MTPYCVFLGPHTQSVSTFVAGAPPRLKLLETFDGMSETTRRKKTDVQIDSSFTVVFILVHSEQGPILGVVAVVLCVPQG